MDDLENLLKLIVEEKKPCYFLSPHFDDAVLSCGDLLAYLSEKTPVTVITFFTTGSEPSTFSARRFLQKCDVKDVSELFGARKKEDETAMKNLSVHFVHKGEVDGTWRKYHKTQKLRRFLGRFIPEFLHLYPTFFQVSSGSLHNEDIKLVNKLKSDVDNILPENIVLFAPLGTGKHVDHMLIREVASKFDHAVFWSDFPYNIKNVADKGFIAKNKLKKYIFNKKSEKKKKAIEAYTSQLPSLFPDGNIPLKDEVYYLA